VYTYLKMAITFQSLGEINAKVADEFIEAMDALPKPVFVHCKVENNFHFPNLEAWWKSQGSQSCL
jgi:hypothetical protein